MDELKKEINGQLHWHISLINRWADNEKYRTIFEKDWERLGKSLKKYGVKTPFEIDENGTVYDGNNRHKRLEHLIRDGITTADNGKALEWIPVTINPVPQNDIEALTIAAKGNGDKNFAIWNKDAIVNEKDKFDQIEDIEDLVFDFEEPETFDETFEYLEEDSDDTPKHKALKAVKCPQCSHEFTI